MMNTEMITNQNSEGMVITNQSIRTDIHHVPTHTSLSELFQGIKKVQEDIRKGMDYPEREACSPDRMGDQGEPDRELHHHSVGMMLNDPSPPIMLSSSANMTIPPPVSPLQQPSQQPSQQPLQQPSQQPSIATATAISVSPLHSSTSPGPRYPATPSSFTPIPMSYELTGRRVTSPPSPPLLPSSPPSPPSPSSSIAMGVMHSTMLSMSARDASSSSSSSSSMRRGSEMMFTRMRMMNEQQQQQQQQRVDGSGFDHTATMRYSSFGHLREGVDGTMKRE